MPAPLLRSAVVADTPSLLGMMQRFYAIDNYPFDKEKKERAIRQLLAEPLFGEIWLLEDQGQPMGYLVVTTGFSLEYNGKDGWVDELFLEEAFRGRGLGKMLLRHAIGRAEALGINFLHLQVERHNRAGRRLYEKEGFEGNGRDMLSRAIL
ncbi:MAG: GNAT family N-acetyltransferase [Phaeodactylibacter sp.]|nr:GNAT family N-acetyltransferase [Phaeodactylibacter sp.]MCB9048911.1 GNAT family N-acetyltransferase [Lewinellaceae bacterium]